MNNNSKLKMAQGSLRVGLLRNNTFVFGNYVHFNGDKCRQNAHFL